MDSIDTKQNATPVRIFGQDSSDNETNPVNSTPAGALHSNLRDNSGNELISRKLPNQSIPTVKAEACTYSAAVNSLVPPGSATDIFTIKGSATKVVRILRVVLSGNQTTHSWRTILGVKRSSDNIGGTFTTRTAVPHDSTNPIATALVRAYTTIPSILGTLVGIIRAERISLPVVTPTTAQSNGPGRPLNWDFGKEGQPVVLRGVNEIFAINLNAVTFTGPSLDIFIEWTEE